MEKIFPFSQLPIGANGPTAARLLRFASVALRKTPVRTWVSRSLAKIFTILLLQVSGAAIRQEEFDVNREVPPAS